MARENAERRLPDHTEHPAGTIASSRSLLPLARRLLPIQLFATNRIATAMTDTLQREADAASGTPANAPSHDPARETPRRSFLVEFGALAVGTVVGLAGLFAGLGVVVDPLIRKKRIPLLFAEGDAAGGDGFLRICTLDSVPDDGVPRRFPVIANQVDAWTFSPDQRIGAVYLRRKPGETDVQVLHATCPHAGCSVSFVPERDVFLCPCHNGAYDPDGERINLPGKDNPSPRPLDKLEVDSTRLANGEVWIRFMNFYTGRHDMTPKI
jgi:menaquinol-cytochrome c reductase iron-sulfur subunit